MSSQPTLMADDGSLLRLSALAGGLGNGSGGSGVGGGGAGEAGHAKSEVEHIHYLSAHIGALYLSDEYSDVTLVVEGQPFSAHRVILAARSDYFRALLFGGMRESRCTEVELKNTPLVAFRHLLRYIYTGQMTLANQKDELILDVLGLAHQYGFVDLETSISDYLRAILSVRNVCLIYDMASMYALQALLQSCNSFMDRHATEVILHSSFLSLSPQGIKDIISRDSFCAPEVDIFKAVHNWVQSNTEESSEMAQQILAAVRLSLMSTQDLLKVVRPTGLVPPDIMLDAIQSRTESRNMELNYRGCLIYEENVATPKHGAVVIQGDYKQALLDGDTKNYDMEKGFTRHTIDDSNTEGAGCGGIVVQLGTQCIINHLRILLWDREPRRTYSYMVDLSMDQNDWYRVVDYSKYHCRSWQDLYFPPRVVRYIRIIGTHNSVNKIFHCVALEAFYTKREFQLDGHNFIVPKQNVATLPMSAYVREGVCRSKNALLNGDTSDYNWDYGYTCHQLGSGALVVQLGQPYALDSMRLLLWDCDDRSYSYYIEVSRNEKDWDLVCDRSEAPCRSWQTITFPRRPVVYIKIVGTRNTANEVFHCVHFECPAATLVSSSLGGAVGGERQEVSNLSSASSSVVTDEENPAAAAAAAAAVVAAAAAGAAAGPQPQHAVANQAAGPSVPAAAAAPTAQRHNGLHSSAAGGKSAASTPPVPSHHSPVVPPSVSAAASAAAAPIPVPPAAVAVPVFPLPGAVGPGGGVVGAQDDAASTASNLANFQDDGDEVDDDDVEDGDGDDSGSGVGPEGEGVLADQMSHHSSPTSYAGSVAGSAAGICANNSLPVGASACSIARAEQELLEGSAASAAGGGSVLGGQRSSKHGSGAGGGGKKGKSSHHKKTAAMSVASSSVSVAQVGVGGGRGGSPLTSSSSSSSSPPSPSPTNSASVAAAAAASSAIAAPSMVGGVVGQGQGKPVNGRQSSSGGQRFSVNNIQPGSSFDNNLTYPAAIGSGHHHPSASGGSRSPFGSAQSLPPLMASPSIAGSTTTSVTETSRRSVDHTAASSIHSTGHASLNLRSLRTTNSPSVTGGGNNWAGASGSASSSPARARPGPFDPPVLATATSASPGGPRLPQNSASSIVGGGHRDRQSQHATTSEAHTNSNGGAVPRRNVRKSDDH